MMGQIFRIVLTQGVQNSRFAQGMRGKKAHIVALLMILSAIYSMTAGISEDVFP